MAKSKDFIICPHCKREHGKSIVLGSSGLINIFGTTAQLECIQCGKEFDVKVNVGITFTTKK